MKSIINFTLNALPFIILGISIAWAMVCKNSEKNYMYLGMSIGTVLGILVGLAVGYMSIGMTAGLLIGEGIGMQFIRKK